MEELRRKFFDSNGLKYSALITCSGDCQLYRRNQRVILLNYMVTQKWHVPQKYPIYKKIRNFHPIIMTLGQNNQLTTYELVISSKCHNNWEKFGLFLTSIFLEHMSFLSPQSWIWIKEPHSKYNYAVWVTHKGSIFRHLNVPK